MARIPNGRAPAAAQTQEEADRRSRLLEAAADLVERDGYERVQMTEIAKTAGVAVGTLYRYFPSKAKLFEIALYEEMAAFAREWRDSRPADRVSELGDQLVLLTRRIVSRPRLAAAMFHASTAGYSSASAEVRLGYEEPLRAMIFAAVGITDPTEVDHQRAQLLMFCWWSILVHVVVGTSAPERGESQLKLACRLLMAESVTTHNGISQHQSRLTF